MNKTKRLVLGVISSLLLAAGFAQAADRLDPLSKSLGSDVTPLAHVATEACATLCDVNDPT
jgi:hypothetical protein